MYLSFVVIRVFLDTCECISSSVESFTLWIASEKLIFGVSGENWAMK